MTGSSGQLGREIARQLSAQHHVVGLDLSPGPWTTHQADFSNLGVLAKLIPTVEAVIHTASLHARHLQSHSKQDFVQVNITNFLKLLELCAQFPVKRLVYTSTTSVYGFAMEPQEKAAWVTEALAPRPRDIYDITKLAAEELCRLFAGEKGLKAICLRTSRFFPEPPDRLALYRLYRGADVRDVARAHVLAATNQALDYAIFNISANHPFQEADTEALFREPLPVLERYYPGIEAIFQQRGWTLPRSLDRVYVTAQAQEKLGYRPDYNFAEFIRGLS